MSTIAPRQTMLSSLRRPDIAFSFLLLFIALCGYWGVRKFFTLAGSTPTLALVAVIIALAGAVPFA